MRVIFIDNDRMHMFIMRTKADVYIWNDRRMLWESFALDWCTDDYGSLTQVIRYV